MGLDLGSRTATKGGTHDAVIMNLTPKCPCEGRVVDRDPTVLQHQFEIAVADREHQIPAHGPQDHLGRELPALEVLALSHAPAPSSVFRDGTSTQSGPASQTCNRSAGRARPDP